MILYYIFPFLIYLLGSSKVSHSLILPAETDCPSDCICYSDYLNNLASWRWIENEYEAEERPIEISFEEHNEVYDMHHGQREVNKFIGEFMQTATCVLRNSSDKYLQEIFNGLKSDTKILSLLQTPGSGNITLEKKHFENLHSLKGLDINGIEEATINLLSNSFDSLNLNFLSLQYVNLPEQLVENKISDSPIKSRSKRIDQNNNGYANTDPGLDENDNSITMSLTQFRSNDGIVNLTIYDKSKYQTDIDADDEIVPYIDFKKDLEKESKDAKNTPSPPKISVAFTNSQHLVYLRLTNCNLEDISWDMFYNLNHLKYLHLEKNELLFLPDFLFYATPNLTTLSLSNNRILSLETIGLAGLFNLRKLDITENHLTHLSELSLPPFPHLEFADFRHNPIETLFPNTFEVMNNTKSLFLGSLKIYLEFFPNSFYGLTSLENLLIVNVKIDILEKPMLTGMPNLKFLTLDGKIDKLSYDAFGEVNKLEKLTLKNCSLRKLSMDSFYGLSALIELDLSHNKLTYLPPGLFDDQNSLREIYLNNNQIQSIASDLFQQTPAKLIRLEGNPWHCNCEISTWDPQAINQVKKYFHRKNNTYCQHKQYDKGAMCSKDLIQLDIKYVYEKRVTPKCETPNKFKGQSVFHVFRKELNCLKKLSKFSKKNKLILQQQQQQQQANVNNEKNIQTPVQVQAIDETTNNYSYKKNLTYIKVKEVRKAASIKITENGELINGNIIPAAAPTTSNPVFVSTNTLDNTTTTKIPMPMTSEKEISVQISEDTTTLSPTTTSTTTTTTAISTKETKNLSIELLEEMEKKLTGKQLSSTHPTPTPRELKKKKHHHYNQQHYGSSSYSSKISSNELMNYLNSKPNQGYNFNLNKNKKRNNELISKKELLRAQLAKLQRMNLMKVDN